MGMLGYFAMKLKNTYNTTNSYGFKVDGRMCAEKFSRKSEIGFGEMCLLILRGSKRSLQAAIYTFLHETKSELNNYSKQAFSQKRQFIKPEAFLTLFRSTTDDFYTTQFVTPKTFRDMHVFAIDGTTYNLPNTAELTEIYGVQTSKGESQTQAKGSCLYDVLNNLLIDVKMLPIKSSERNIAVDHLNYLHNYKPNGNLVLLDRGYPSLELIRYFEDKQIFYLMRCNKNEFISEVRKVTDADKVIQLDRQIPKTKEQIRATMRVIQVPFDNGDTETLITNLTDSSFLMQDFKYLYHLRWGIEEKYNEIKNKLKIEAFSGVTPVAVLQDFYATMFLTNMVSFAEMDCEKELDLISQSRERKYEYRINTTMAIASVKDSLIELVMIQSPRKLKRKLDQLGERLIANIIPIRPSRSYERRRKHTASKYPQNRGEV